VDSLLNGTGSIGASKEELERKRGFELFDLESEEELNHGRGIDIYGVIA